MDSDSVAEIIDNIWGDAVNAVISDHVPPESLEEQWDVPGLVEAIKRDFGQEYPIQQWLDEEASLDEEGLRERIEDKLRAAYAEKREEAGPQIMDQIEKAVLLQVLDSLWREHLAAMDYLRKGIHLRGYAQKDPKNEYKREAFAMFTEMLDRLKHDTITVLARGQIRAEISEEAQAASRERSQNLDYQHEEAASAAAQQDAAAASQQDGGAARRQAPAAMAASGQAEAAVADGPP